MADAEVIYAWMRKSDHGAGKYEVILKRNGTLECPCAGWIWPRKDPYTGLSKPRTCKHVREKEAEAESIMARIRAGQSVPRPEVVDDPVQVRRRPAAIKADDMAATRKRAINF